ncbi:unnamed protein product [Periconia digitata]|uniref:Uncharacterized protein n=1 Tax=Periconia digitata TaxID=1303443 RepID=A0A9W4TZK8_9PLEO|nr:unnamed protein product [Periconia digitata]
MKRATRRFFDPALETKRKRQFKEHASPRGEKPSEFWLLPK